MALAIIRTADETAATLEAWRVDYNLYRPHSALGHLPPSEFARTRLAVFEKPEILNLQPV